MDDHSVSKIISIASPFHSQREKIRAKISSAQGLAAGAIATDLSGLIKSLEMTRPHAVIISGILASQPNFSTARSQLEGCNIPCYYIDQNATRIPRDLLNYLTKQLEEDRVKAQRYKNRATITRKVGEEVPKSPSTLDVSKPEIYDKIVLIGASTGGVDALLKVLENFTSRCPPTVIVQHTGTGFGESLSSLLDRRLAPKVELLKETTELRPGLVLLGAGQLQHVEIQKGARPIAAFKNLAPVSGHLPSVDHLFRSAVDIGPKVVAALLTGMGRDGALGLKALKQAGAYTIAQDKESSVVYGMPKAAVELDAASAILSLDMIGSALLRNAAKCNMTLETPE